MLQDKVFQVSIVIVCALVIWSLINPVDDTVPATVGNVAAFLIMGFLASTVVSAIYRIAKGSWPKWQIWISVPFIGIFMYLAYVGIQFDPQALKLETASPNNAFVEDEIEDAAEEMQEGDIDGWLEVIQKNPEDADAWRTLGRAYRIADENEKAIEAYQRAADLFELTDQHLKVIKTLETLKQIPHLDPELAHSILYNKGSSYLMVGQSDKAIKAFQQYLKFFPQDDEVWGLLGFAYLETGQNVKAIDALRRCAELDPADEEIWHLIGRLYTKTERWDEAIAALEKYIRIEPECPETWYFLGYAYGESGDSEKEKTAYQKAYLLDPDIFIDYGLMFLSDDAYTLSLDAHTLALNAFQLATEYNKDDVDAWYGLGDTLMELGRNKEALEMLKKALILDSNRADIWFSKGLVYHDSGQINSAIEAYRESLRLYPKNSVAWYNIGLCYSEADEQSKVIEAYTQLKKIKPDLAEKFFEKFVLP